MGEKPKEEARAKKSRVRKGAHFIVLVAGLALVGAGQGSLVWAADGPKGSPGIGCTIAAEPSATDPGKEMNMDRLVPSREIRTQSRPIHAEVPLASRTERAVFGLG